MIIDLKKLTPEELTAVSEDLAQIVSKKLYTGAGFSFWHELLKGIILENDRRIAKDIEEEEQAGATIK